MPLRKPVVSETRVKEAVVLGDKTLTLFPVLLSYLMDDAYEDGSPRERSAVSLFIEEGRVKVALNDKQERRSLYVSSDGLQGALKALEGLLATDKGDWRSWGKSTKKK